MWGSLMTSARARGVAVVGGKGTLVFSTFFNPAQGIHRVLAVSFLTVWH